MRRLLLALAVPVLLAGCGAHGTPTAIAPAAGSTSAKATLGRPFIDDPGQPGAAVCQTAVPTPRPPFSAMAADTLEVECVQVSRVHNFAGSGTRALVKGTRGGRAIVVGFSKMMTDDGGTSVDASIDGQRRPVAEVEALLAAAPVSPRFPQSVKATLLGML